MRSSETPGAPPAPREEESRGGTERPRSLARSPTAPGRRGTAYGIPLRPERARSRSSWRRPSRSPPATSLCRRSSGLHPSGTRSRSPHPRPPDRAPHTRPARMPHRSDARPPHRPRRGRSPPAARSRPRSRSRPCPPSERLPPYRDASHYPVVRYALRSSACDCAGSSPTRPRRAAGSSRRRPMRALRADRCRRARS